MMRRCGWNSRSGEGGRETPKKGECGRDFEKDVEL
jgi:hypothetical protein